MTTASTDGEQPVEPRTAELEAALADRDAAIAVLTQRVAVLQSQVTLLTEKLGQNSKNSHLPPSSDGPGAGSAGKRDDKKKASKRKRGGQKKHRGAHRELAPVDRVDTIVDLFPPVCSGCATTLPQIPDTDPRRYQLLDLEVGTPRITEFRRHEVRCPRCGRETIADYDATKIPSSPFGPRLVAVVSLLTGVHHLSRRTTQTLLYDLFRIKISLGAISAIEARASKALKPAFDEAQREVEAATIKHTDATSWTQAGMLLSLWTIASTLATVYHIVGNGCRATIQPLFGPLFGILISDRASVFGFWCMAMRQICWAHLIRKFVSFSERDGPAGAIGRELLECAGLVFDYWHAFKNGKLTREELEAWIRPVRIQFDRILQRAIAAKIARVSGSCADIVAHAEALWTFVTHEGVEPTNNHAERELRAFVLWRKRSFGSQSERGDRFAERLMTVAHTARKRGKNVLDFIVRSVTAQVHGTTPPSLLAA